MDSNHLTRLTVMLLLPLPGREEGEEKKRRNFLFRVFCMFIYLYRKVQNNLSCKSTLLFSLLFANEKYSIKSLLYWASYRVKHVIIMGQHKHLIHHQNSSLYLLKWYSERVQQQHNQESNISPGIFCDDWRQSTGLSTVNYMNTTNPYQQKEKNPQKLIHIISNCFQHQDYE